MKLTSDRRTVFLAFFFLFVGEYSFLDSSSLAGNRRKVEWEIIIPSCTLFWLSKLCVHVRDDEVSGGVSSEPEDL